jgi:hypothetical protein
MRKFSIGTTAAVAFTFAGILAWNAGATPLAGSAATRSGALIERTGCVLSGHCGVGKHKVCDHFHVCQCTPC